MSQGNLEDFSFRLTIDLSMEQYAYLKKLAQKKGMSMYHYVIESLCENMETEKHINLSENVCKKNLKQGD